jgi:hypothetical protein
MAMSSIPLVGDIDSTLLSQPWTKKCETRICQASSLPSFLATRRCGRRWEAWTMDTPNLAFGLGMRKWEGRYHGGARVDGGGRGSDCRDGEERTVPLPLPLSC